MTLDRTVFARARAVLEERRKAREDMMARRREEAAGSIPGLNEIDTELRNVMSGVFRAALEGGDAEDKIRAAGEESLRLQEERRRLLENAGFPRDYLDEKEDCPRCRDTGFAGTEPCDCLMEIYRKEQARELSALTRLQGENFDSFQLFWYSNDRNESGISPRAHMRAVLEYCRSYARSFSSRSDNLLFTGGPGLGKTFLSACIAGTVSENGHSVVYQTAGEVFSAFEKARFGKGEQEEEAEAALNRLMNCDLLILDDLGTEMTNSLTVAGLYELINTRLSGGKKTIISTNLTPSELAGRYSPQVSSRILGEYEILRFAGEDIRILKKRER